MATLRIELRDNHGYIDGAVETYDFDASLLHPDRWNELSPVVRSLGATLARTTRIYNFVDELRKGMASAGLSAEEIAEILGTK